MRIFIYTLCLGLGTLTTGCGDAGSMTGLINLNKPKAGSIPLSAGKSLDSISSAQQMVVSNGGYKISASMGDTVPVIKKTTEANYTVFLSIEGTVSN
jgi:hypothetical protein